ncbi:MAG: carboxypeptidase-like regulatory domain-containing protein [Prevotellaceae bacterium]|jgi:hypothetical protein|nr:carboxypeptidase-like regulatory domain-containing protein [Prevotellaceae bacterium]
MKIKLFLAFTLSIFLCDMCYSQNSITISGRVTDFDGTAIDSSIVEILHADFTSAYETYTDKDGYYSINNVKKGKYLAIYAMRPKEYPRANAVPDDEMRLEFWAWNVIADTDLVINPRYHRLELYGTNVFRVEGGYNSAMIYVRPMSVGKLLSYTKDIYLNKSKSEHEADISVAPEHFKAKVFMDEQELPISSIQPVEEYEGSDKLSMTGYLIQADLPQRKPEKQYCVFRIEAENTEYGEKGENLYFYELKNYE